MTRLLEGGEWVATGEAAVMRAAALLDGDGILGHPTSTLYGLGGRPRPEIDADIARLKGRAEARPLIRIAASLGTLQAACPDLVWSRAATALADAFWPGPLTLILASSERSGGIAVRVDGHPVIGAMLEAAGGVMTSTSLNQTGKSPTAFARDAREAFVAMPEIDRAVAFLDAGDLGDEAPSTIVRVDAGDVSILREGGLSSVTIQETIGKPGQ